MIKCTGIHCPVQFDPTSDFTPFTCKVTDTCEYATPLTDDQIKAILFLLLYAVSQSEEYKQIQEQLTPPPTPASKPYGCCENCRKDEDK